MEGPGRGCRHPAWTAQAAVFRIDGTLVPRNRPDAVRID
jgi:hypothetical protein